MNEFAVRRVVVTDGEKPLGIITLDDVVWVLYLLVSNLNGISERQIDYERRHEIPRSIDA